MISRRQFLRGDFSGRKENVAGGLAAIISARCIAYANTVCRSCAEACDAGAIRFRPRLGGAAVPEIEDVKCMGCGACVAPCPSGAVVVR